jgi:hypothetical protein
MRVVAIAAIITSLAVPALAQGDPSKAEAKKTEERKKQGVRRGREGVPEHAQKYDSRTTCQENRPVGPVEKFTLVYLCARTLRAALAAPTRAIASC